MTATFLVALFALEGSAQPFSTPFPESTDSAWPWSTFDSTSTGTGFYTPSGSEIELACGSSYSGYRSPYQMVYFKFVSDASYAQIVLESCKSDHDTYLYLYNDAGYSVASADDQNNYYGADCSGGTGSLAGDLEYSPYWGIPTGDIYYFGVGGFSSSYGYYHIQMICNVDVYDMPSTTDDGMWNTDDSWSTTDYRMWPSETDTDGGCEDSGEPVCCYGYVFDSYCEAQACYQVTSESVQYVADLQCDDDTTYCPAGTDLTQISRNDCCQFDFSDCCVKTCDDGSSLQGYYDGQFCNYFTQCGACSGYTFECPASSGVGSVTLDAMDNCEFEYEQCCAEESGCVVSDAEYDYESNTIYCDYDCTEPTSTEEAPLTTTEEDTDDSCLDDWKFDLTVESVCEFCSCEQGTATCKAFANLNGWTEDLGNLLLETACPIATYTDLKDQNGQQCELENIRLKEEYSSCDCNAIECNDDPLADTANRCVIGIGVLVVLMVRFWM